MDWAIGSIFFLYLVFPLIFHSLNGIRHLWWDAGLGMGIRTVQVTGWSIVLATIAGSTYILSKKK
jgi:succinate dehydrogenase cytochrome b556 subunit